MEKNPSQSNSLVRTKYEPYIKWHKDTDEWECRAVKKTYIEEIKKEDNMGKFKQIEVEYEPVILPVEKKILDNIARLIIGLRNPNILKVPNIDKSIIKVDDWLTKQYEEHGKANQTKNEEAPKEPIVCEEG